MPEMFAHSFLHVSALAGRHVSNVAGAFLCPEESG